MAGKKEAEKKNQKIGANVKTKKAEPVQKQKAEVSKKHEVEKKEVVKDADKQKEKKPAHKRNVEGKKKTPEMKKAAKMRDKIKKKKHPVFRGRFGKKQFRRRSIKKWQKWRYPRGIDIFFRKEDGSIPRIGYRVPKEFRNFHPSGMREVKVANLTELEKAGKDVAVRISGKVGNRKRKEIIKKANEIGVKVLN